MDQTFLKQNNRSVEQHPASHGFQWLFGLLLITLSTVIWGYSNVVIRQGETTIAPSVLLWVRFVIASLILSPALFRHSLSLKSLVTGLATGSLLGVVVLAQGWSMLSVPVDEVAFITSLYVIFTPFGIAAIQRKLPSKMIWGAVPLSLIGVVLMIGKLTFHLQIGIIGSLIAALAATGQIIGTTSLARTVSAVQLAALQAIGAGLFMTLVVGVQGSISPSIYKGLFQWSITEWIWIGYLAVFSTVVAIFLQSWGQRRVTATEAALAFNMEPVWTAVFAWVILSQGMTSIQIIGAVLIVGSLAVISKPKQAVKNRLDLLPEK
ncbi:DMT family transporter [Pullulanibacillus sp. KACC 23026]|uniref:DMT family transporter n=1 Tax=Pullulanibacillus sp. KACC 23026 TaxID=3028315 RepID=UPI0023AF4D13|nr:DMT family transporter [Pullulanibacillus sp. KACC 23026]WEG13267.1 DMT family transporter [Pullulanibacillus sp. KACC 23026]